MGWLKSLTQVFTAPVRVVEKIIVNNPPKVGGLTPKIGPINVQKAEDRITTVKPQSFTPANIARAGGSYFVANTVGGVAPTGLKIEGYKVADTSQRSDAPVSAFGTGLYSYGRVQAGDPNKKESGLNSWLRVLGGVVGTYATANVFTVVAGPITPSSTPSSVYAVKSVSFLSSSYEGSQVGGLVIGVFGRKVGTAILQIFSGDFVGAYKTLSTDLSPMRNPNLFASYEGGGGSGLGVTPGGYSGQSSLSPIWYPIMGLGILGLVWFLRRK